jgi:ATP adenylyltransferase
VCGEKGVISTVHARPARDSGKGCSLSHRSDNSTADTEYQTISFFFFLFAGAIASAWEFELSHETLWAPWRLDYIRATKPGGCFICQGVVQSNDRENWVVSRGPSTVVILNRFPYNNGHLLVAPKAHKGKLQELSDEEMLELMRVQRRMVELLDQILTPHGYNIGLNLGEVAGAGLPGHLHWHIVPRWNADTNFMPVLSNTRVIVQSLESLYELMQRFGQTNGPES